MVDGILRRLRHQLVVDVERQHLVLQPLLQLRGAVAERPLEQLVDLRGAELLDERPHRRRQQADDQAEQREPGPGQQLDAELADSVAEVEADHGAGSGDDD